MVAIHREVYEGAGSHGEEYENPVEQNQTTFSRERVGTHREQHHDHARGGGKCKETHLRQHLTQVVGDPSGDVGSPCNHDGVARNSWLAPWLLLIKTPHRFETFGNFQG